MDEVFVGREIELAFLRGRLEETLKGMSRTVLVEGAEGIGKTALLDAFLARIGHHRALRISGAELEAGLAYGVVDQLLEETGQPPPERFAGLGTGRAADVEPLRIGGALVEMLGDLQAGGQILVVLDDAHWADVPSLHAFAFALRRLRFRPVLMLLAVRDDRADHLRAALHALLAGPMAVRLRLAGLDVEELRGLSTALGTGSLSPRAAKRLHEHTGGNPLHARALLEEIPVSVLHHGVGPLPAPRSFALLVLARLAGCSPSAENLVAAASVLGTSCSLRLASRLGKVTDPLRALEQATAAHLLRDHPTAIERLIVFPHPLVRAAVYHDLGPARRADLHVGAARLVESEPAALRHRVAAACGSDPKLAAEAAALADRQAAAGSWTAAADNLLAAATLAATAAERERSVLTAIDYLRLGGNAAEASSLADELAAFAEGAPENYGRARLRGTTRRQTGAGDLPADACRQAEPGSQSKLAAAIWQQLGVCRLLNAYGEAAMAWARQALAVPSHPPEAPEPSDTSPSRSATSSGLSGGCEPITLPQPAWPPPPSCPDPSSAGSSGQDRRICRGIARAWTDDLPGARDELASALTACERHRPPLPWGLVGLGFLAETEYRLGAWDDAIAHAELAVSIVQDTGENWLAPFIHAIAAFPLAARGAREAAAAHATEATARMLSGTENGTTWVATAHALLACAEGEDQRVASALKPLYLPTSNAAREPGWQPWQALYAEALLNLGSRQLAEAVLCPFEALAATRGRRSALAAAARVRGTLEAAHGHPQRAEAAFRDALKHASDLPMPFERAALETAYGRYLRRAGRSNDAAMHLEAARTRFAQLDARPYLQRCEMELAACHQTPPTRKTGATTALTRQEQAVARLVADGHTNRETAEALVVSVKTIEYHLGNAYAKLGVTSRTQLALAIRQDSGNP